MDVHIGKRRPCHHESYSNDDGDGYDDDDDGGGVETAKKSQVCAMGKSFLGVEE